MILHQTKYYQYKTTEIPGQISVFIDPSNFNPKKNPFKKILGNKALQTTFFYINNLDGIQAIDDFKSKFKPSTIWKERRIAHSKIIKLTLIPN